MDDNVVNLSSKRKADPAVVKLVDLGNDIDTIILHYIEQGCDPKEVTVIVGHRLSELLLRFVGDEREQVWETVSDIILKRLRDG
jgi:hypothetical protein